MGVGAWSTDLPFIILQRVSKLPRADTGINFAVDAYIPGLYGSHAVPNAAYPHAESQFPVSIWHGIPFCRSPVPLVLYLRTLTLGSWPTGSPRPGVGIFQGRPILAYSAPSVPGHADRGGPVRRTAPPHCLLQLCRCRHMGREAVR